MHIVGINEQPGNVAERKRYRTPRRFVNELAEEYSDVARDRRIAR